MNERIKELIKQATEEIANPFDPWQYDKFFNQEKFAELIVKECIAECWYDATPKQISDNIKTKFGVE